MEAVTEREQIENIVKAKIEADELPGDKPGGSGHISDIGYTLDEIEEVSETANGLKITYKYSTIISTEFTIEPDNPPYVYHNRKWIIIDKQGKILEESERESTPAPDNPMFDDLDLSHFPDEPEE